MDLKKKLKKIDDEIASGLKFKAADQLRNMINVNPNDLTLWNKLAELYYEGGFLDAAGRYWILFEPNDDRIRKSIEIYTKSTNNSGYQILREITFRGDKDKLPHYARKKLFELEADSFKQVKTVPKFTPILNKQQKKKPNEKRTLKDKIIEKIFIGFIILILILAIVGLIRVIQWIF